jgi:hypothetical protein
MSIPPEIQELINRIELQLQEIELEVSIGVNRLKQVLTQEPENAILIQCFAYLNALLFFIETSKQQIQGAIDNLEPVNVPQNVIFEAGEDLGFLLGRILEERMRLQQISNFLEELP